MEKTERKRVLDDLTMPYLQEIFTIGCRRMSTLQETRYFANCFLNYSPMGK